MTSQDISNQIVQTATSYGVDPRLALEVARQESGLDNSRISSAGAIGIFQLLPSTAADLGIDPHDPAQNIDGGIRYLSQLIGKYAGNEIKVDNQDYLIIREDEVLGVIEGGTKLAKAS